MWGFSEWLLLIVALFNTFTTLEDEPAAKGKDYSLLKADTQTMQPVTFSGPLPHLVTPWAA